MLMIFSNGKTWKPSKMQFPLTLIIIIIIIVIIKICSAHISTLLGAQGAETEKTWIQTIYNDSKNNMCRDTCIMQLQIYIIFDKLWHKMSFKQRLKSGFTMTRFEFSWKITPESRSRDRKRKRSITPLIAHMLHFLLRYSLSIIEILHIITENVFLLNDAN